MMVRVIEDDAAAELRSLRPLITDPAGTVVLARHGLQWWAGYLLKVPVREEGASAELIAKYQRVLVLEQKGGRQRGPERRGPSSAGADGGILVHDGEHVRLTQIRPGV
jgi:hypothetical protein